jgi:hypothetical protein
VGDIGGLSMERIFQWVLSMTLGKAGAQGYTAGKRGSILKSSSMKTWRAILLTVGLWMGASMVRFQMGDAYVSLVPLMVLVSSAWVVRDAERRGLREVEPRLAHHRLVLFIGCVVLWVVAFPWYLTVRGREGKALV